MDDHANDSILARLRESGIEAPRRRLRDAISEETPLLREVELHEIGRYEVLGRIAEGGVGQVAKARDVDLGRDVAIKALKEEHLDNPDLLRRFVEEAQIGGQLQHPGIVPVYEMGLQSDGRPFFAMKLVKGQTLTALLATRKSPTENLRRALSIFEQICRTMAYAHARGVIHRDLKPSNVMVGAFGEVQILDWGFAKVLAQGGVADERRAKEMKRDVTVISTLRSEGIGSESIPGSVMGTPAYMPPEQALGHVDSLDERSDVFSLGAILTEILTGEPAYTGDGLEKLVKAAEADLQDANARLDACGQDPELVKLARACLAPLRPDRPAHAGMVTRAVTAYLTGVEERARKSELRAAKARGRAEQARQAAAQQKRSRRQMLVLAASVLLLIAIAAGGLAFLEHDRRTHLAGAVEEVRNGMRQATLLRGRDGPAAALSMAMRAHDRAKTGDIPSDLLEETGVLVADLKIGVSELLAAAAQQTIDDAMQRTIESIRIDRGPGLGHVGYDDALLAAFLDYGIDVEGTDLDGAIEKLRSSAIRQSLALVLDEWALMRRTKEALADRDANRLLAFGRAVDDDPWRNRVRECIGQANFEGLHRLAEDLDPREQPAESIDFLARLLMNPGDYVRAEALLSRAVKEYRGDYWLNLHLSECLFELRWRDNRRTREDAVRFAGAALAIAPKSPWAWYQLAKAKLGAREDPAEMEYAVRRALELQPDYAAAHNHLAAFVLKPRGQIEEAISHYREAIRILPSEPNTHSNVVLALCADNRAQEALREAERALQRFRKMPGFWM